MNSSLEKDVRIIQTEDLRNYLTDYQMQNGLSKVTIDNIRRILSSFFAWLEDEDYIIKSPVRRIHKVKACGYLFLMQDGYCDFVKRRNDNVLFSCCTLSCL